MPTSVPNFNFAAPLVTEIKRVSQNLMWGLLAPDVPRTLKLLCVLKVLGKVKQRAKFQHREVMRICNFHRLSIMCPIMRFLGVWRVKILSSPKGTTLREYASVGVSRVKIGSTA